MVIGRKTKSVSEAEALNHVAGYMPVNDVSARRWQFADKRGYGASPATHFVPQDRGLQRATRCAILMRFPSA